MKTKEQQLQEILNEKLSYKETAAKIDKLMPRGDGTGCSSAHTKETGSTELVCPNQAPPVRIVVTVSGCADPADNYVKKGPWYCE